MYAPFTDQVPHGELMSLDDRPHQIGELAAKFGITLRTIRFYEERGLIRPRRVSARTRLYDMADVARLSLIVTCRRFGLSVDDIAALLAIRDGEGSPAFKPRLVEALNRRHAEMTAEIAEAEKLRDELAVWLADVSAGA